MAINPALLGLVGQQGGLLGLGTQQPLTPEEEEALRQEQLIREQMARLGATDPLTAPNPAEDPAAYQQPPAQAVPEDLPPDEPPLVIDSEDDEEPLSADVKVETKTVAKPGAKPADKPKVVNAEPQPPKVVDETIDASDSTLLDIATRERALQKQRDDTSINTEMPVPQARYQQELERAFNDPKMFDLSKKDWQNFNTRLIEDIYADEVQPVLNEEALNKAVEYRKKGGKAFIAITPEGAEATSRDPNENPTFTQSVAKGGATTAQLLWAGVEAGAELTGAEGVAKSAEERRRSAQTVASVLPEGVRFSEIENVTDALQWVKQTVAEQGPMMAGPMSGATVGRIVAGSLGAKLGAFGPSWLLGTGEIESANKDINPDQKAGLTTLVGGSVVAALDSVLGQRVSASLVKTLGRRDAEDVARRILLLPADSQLVESLRRGATEAGKDALIESSTEAAQGLVQELATAKETGTPIKPGMLLRLVEQAAAGAVMGTATGATTGAAEAQGGRRIALDELRNADINLRGAGPRALSPSRGDVQGRPQDALPEARPLVIDADQRGEQPVRVRPTARPVDREGNEQRFQIPNGRVTSRFGPRQTFQTANGRQASRNHMGVDIGLPSGAPAPVGADGVVVFAGTRGGYGNQVVVKHSDGTTSSYSHLSRIGVEVGDTVTQGEAVGRVGATGNATGPHLHLERRDAQGHAINPQTGSVIRTTEWADGSVHDDTEFEVDQEPLENTMDDLVEPGEIDRAYAEATGQQFDYGPTAQPAQTVEGPAAPAAISETPVATEPSSGPLRGEPVREEAIPQAIRQSPVPQPDIVATAATERLAAAKQRNPARAEFDRIRAENDAAAQEETAAPQPMAGEEPIYDETQTNIVGFINPETGATRAIEAAGPSQGAPSPEQVAASQPVEAVSSPALPAAPAEGYDPSQDAGALERQARDEYVPDNDAEMRAVLNSLPRPGPRASEDSRAGRLEGQRSGVGLVDTLTDEQLATQSRSFRTAYNLGLMEARQAMAAEPVADEISGDISPQTPVATEGSASFDEVSAQRVEMSRREDEALAKMPTPRKQRTPAAVEAQSEKYYDKLFDLEVEGTKGDAKRFALKLVREGVIDQAEYDGLSYLFSDRDMGVEDVTSELRTSIDIWAKRATGAKAARVENGGSNVQAGQVQGTQGRSAQADSSRGNKDPATLVRQRLARASGRATRAYEKASGANDRGNGRVATYRGTRDFAANNRVAGYPTVTMEELRPTTANVTRFRDAINQSKGASRYGAAVYVYDAQDYLKMRLFVSEDGRSGFALKSDGDIVSVFSDGGGKVHSMLSLAVQEGGNKLDAFDTVLPEIYSISGFKEVARDKWNDEYAPDGWDKETFAPFNNGKPDVVYMVYDANYSPFAETSDAGTEQAGRGNNDQDGQTGNEAAGRELDRPPVEADGTIVLDHWSKAEDLSETDPDRWGQFKNAFTRDEQAYMAKAPTRTYFGIQTGKNGGYKLEFQGRKLFQARVRAAQLYDVAADPDNLWVRGQPWAGEQAIKDAGYVGYWHKNPELGLVAVVFQKVNVQSASRATATRSGSEGRTTDTPLPSARAPAPQISRAERQAKTDRRNAYKAYNENVRRQVAEVLRGMALDGRNDLTIEVVDAIMGRDDIAGHYDYADRRIRIAAFASHDVRQTARHEIIHWARDNGVFNREEWRELQRWVQGREDLMSWARENYKGSTQDEIIEEAIAEGFARWDGGSLEAPQGLVATAFEKFRALIQAVREAFGAAGVSRGQINKAAALLSDLESGAQIKKADARKAQYAGNKAVFGRKQWHNDLSHELLAKNITPEEHHYLTQNPRDKFQRAWHGSPHDFNAFALDYIGNGEGAQAFGWGLYFAEQKEVADWYRRKLSQPKADPVDVVMQVNGKDMRDFVRDRLGDKYATVGYEVADRLYNFLSTGKPYNGWTDALEVQFEKDTLMFISIATREGNEQEVAELQTELERGLAVFASLRNQKITEKDYGKQGKLYQVEVPSKDLMVNLDKKLGQQSKEVIARVLRIRSELGQTELWQETERDVGDVWEWTGHRLQRVLKSAAWLDALPRDDEAVANAVDNDHHAMAASVYMRSVGIPGVYYFDRDSRLGGQSSTSNFVIFDDSQIQLQGKFRVVKSNVANSPLSDPTIPNPSLFRRIHDFTMGFLGAIAGKDVDAADNIVDAFRRKVTQRYQQVIKTQKRAAQQLGIDRLASGQNPMEMITADERGYKLQYLTENMVRPMAQEMARRGVTMADLGLFLYARHAPARNARVAAINPEFRDPLKPGSGMTNDEANQIMATFAQEGRIPDLHAIAQHIDAMIAYAQQERMAGDLITAQDVAAGFQPGDFYVPLRGNESIEPELEMGFALPGRRGGGFSVAGKESHRMFGRSSLADLEEIVGYTITQAQEAIDRSYRNRVAKSMKEMFTSVPDPEFVQIDRVKRVAVWNKAKGQVEYQMQTRMTDPMEQQRTIFVKEGGTVHKMTFNAKNPSAMRFVAAAKNLGMAELPRYLQLMSMFTRIWSKANTQWNIDFVLANATKDIQTGVLNASTLDIKGLRRSMIRNLASLKPLMGAWMGSTNAAGAGFNSNNQWFQVYAEFEANGGKLNYGQIEPLDDAIKSARREIRQAARGPVNPIRLATNVLMWIDHANGAFENMTRLAAYKALRDHGIGPKRAAEAVRELTTNFQQHGEWGPKFNAAYGFANASVIGGARFAYTVAKNPAIIAGLIGLGMLEDWLNSMLDEDEWDRFTEEDKHGNFMLVLPASFGFDVKVPAGYGLNAFITTGRKFSELWRGKKNKDGTAMSVLDAASDTMMGFVNAFAPITGATFFNVVTPTIADPIVNIYQNQNNWGRPIMPPQSFRKEQQKPDSQLAFENTAQFWKTLATTMNAIGGGNEVVPGWTPLDISPESYKHVTEETVGGVGRTFMRALNTTKKLVNGEPVGPNDIPVVRRFAGNPYGATNANEEQLSNFYERMGEARTAIAQAKEMMARFGKESSTYQSFRKDNEPLINFYPTIDAADKKLRALNAAENAAERGANRIEGLNRRDRKAIFKATKFVVPSGKKLTPEQVAKIKAKTKEKKEALAVAFNERYQSEVMGE